MYDPKDLLKLYLYGYMNRIRSSRKLKIETKRNLEVMWLLGKLSPDHKTIARFRYDNPDALKNVFRDFVKLCLGLGFYGADVVAVDGSKFKAVNSKERNFGKKKLDERIERIEAKIVDYMNLLDEADGEDGDASLAAADIQAIVESLTKRKQEYEGYLSELEETKQYQKSLTDPDSRLMLANGKMDVCYNVQTAVDDKYKLIVEFDATNRPTDKNLLEPMTESAAEILEVESLTVVADKGYDAASDISQCIRKGHDPHVMGSNIEICVPTKPGTGEMIESHAKGRTVYIPERNVAICPMGQTLYPKYYKTRINKAIFYNTKACKQCGCKCIGSGSKNYRFEYAIAQCDFSPDYDDGNLEVRRITIRPDKELTKRCKSIVEHPFGTVKRHLQSDYCLTKGLGSVKGEFSLLFLAYNLKRVINIVGVKKLVGVLSS